MTDDWSSRFGGIARLYGQEGLRRLQNAHVCVVGVGGVGSWSVEALARSGIGTLTLIDLDDVCVTNVNRQLPAIDGQIGRPKVTALAERISRINPSCKVHALAEFFTSSTADDLLQTRYDFVVDAIDKLSNKCLLIARCRAAKIPIITVGGAGGKREGCRVQVRDLAKSEQDDLLRFVRRKLRREYGFPNEKGAEFGVPCVFSSEKPVYPWANGTCAANPESGSALTLDCGSGFGTATFVTGTFGFIAAGEVVRRIALE